MNIYAPPITMSPVSTIVDDPQYASCPVLPKDMNQEDSFEDPPSSERFDNYQRGGRRRLSSSTVSPSDTSTGSSVDSELSDEEKLQIESSFRGLKTQMFVCNSLANLYVGKVSSRTQENNNINWELHYTGIPVIILDTGETGCIQNFVEGRAKSQACNHGIELQIVHG
ncbi:uncharacterized protein LOC103516959 [Diaphorina citri]|uniref:Uncharacterized protein LOC103516959 n=1 Tax=Diaphorina citri TaxID=121845 RepID=A0A3Q0J953_DIACI|nr:uncharacterized protein LOC103516959 [Diaphorina citri]